MTTAKSAPASVVRKTPPPVRCVIDGEPLRSNAERRAGLCAYHLATLAKQKRHAVGPATCCAGHSESSV